ncbi:hypothetical protein OAQ96_03195, partial [Alphaproteobacteria bacterium]|nr:hypothetical protein [Alphaproteobacteria bacterium]
FSVFAIENERYYSKKFCVDLFSGTPEDKIKEEGKTIAFIDCSTSTKAMEFGWAEKDVFDNIGQSLFYSAKTGKSPTIVLLVKKDIKENDIRKSIRKIEDVNKAFGLYIEIILLKIPDGEVLKYK